MSTSSPPPAELQAPSKTLTHGVLQSSHCTSQKATVITLIRDKHEQRGQGLARAFTVPESMSGRTIIRVTKSLMGEGGLATHYRDF